jgi:2-methylcitrate dehydratase PrpD
MASGIIEYLAEGAWTKRMHPGWAAQAGYRAARMAQAGFSGPRTLFEASTASSTPSPHPRRCTSRPCWTAPAALAGRRHRLQALCLRHHGAPLHRLRAQAGGAGAGPGEIEAIECETAEGIVHRLWEPLASKQNPPNGYAAKFSVPYAIAVGMLRGDAGLGEYEEAVVQDPACARSPARCAT